MEKITLNDFWNTPRRYAIHCQTKEEAIKLLTAFDKMGKRWCTGQSYLEDNYYWVHEYWTYYVNDGTLGKRFLDKNYKIYEFEDVILEDRKAKPYEELPVLFCEDGFEPTIPLPDVEKEIKYVEQLINETAALARKAEMYKATCLDYKDIIQGKNDVIEKLKAQNAFQSDKIARLKQEKEGAELMADEERRRVSEMIELVDEIDSAAEKTKKLVDRIEFLFITVSLLDLLINIAVFIVIWTRH